MRSLKLSPPGIVLAILCAMYFLYFVNRTNLAIAGPLMQADLGLDNGDLGLVLGAFGIPYAVFQLFGGAIGDKFGPRLTLAVSALIVCLATGWIGAAGGLAWHRYTAPGPAAVAVTVVIPKGAGLEEISMRLADAGFV